MQDPLVSIIIPVYNRVDLVHETLNSISAQTYSHWECLLTDDGSDDGTVAVIEEYVQKDQRFKLFHRPSNRLNGGNACRNIGLENAQGECIIFFDSDDLMTPNHVEYKVRQLQAGNADFVITRTKFFGENITQKELAYDFKDSDISVLSFIQLKVRWITQDVCIWSHIAKQVRFNETLRSGQEFNYYVKLLIVTERGKLCDEVVTMRRMHQSSIRGVINVDHAKALRGQFRSFLVTYHDIRHYAPAHVRRELLFSCAEWMYRHFPKLNSEKHALLRAIQMELGIRSRCAFALCMIWLGSSNQRFRNWSYRLYQYVMVRLKPKV